jgi:hypothetical protein
MKWPQGLAVITRAEHWDLASKHLWGLSSSDIAAYLHSPHSQNAPVSGESLRTESCSEISNPGVKGTKQYTRGGKPSQQQNPTNSKYFVASC